jgi:hypothetical protein
MKGKGYFVIKFLQVTSSLFEFKENENTSIDRDTMLTISRTLVQKLGSIFKKNTLYKM